MSKKQILVICTYCPDLGVYHLCDEKQGADFHLGDRQLIDKVEALRAQGREEEMAVVVACTARAKVKPHKMVVLFSDGTFEVHDPVRDPDPLAEEEPPALGK